MAPPSERTRAVHQMKAGKAEGIEVLLQGQTLEVLIDPAVGMGEVESAAATSESTQQIVLGVASMIKQPGREIFETWLAYHAEEIGCQRFYLRIEDTPELEPLIESSAWRDRVHVDFATGTVRDWTGVATRQARHVQRAIERARSDGVTHLISIDVDELLFLPAGRAALHAHIAALPPHLASLHCRNLEALVPSIRCRNPFAEARCFRHRPWEYGAYGYPPSSGKSIGVLHVDGLTTNGPHHFGIEGSLMIGEPLYRPGRRADGDHGGGGNSGGSSGSSSGSSRGGSSDGSVSAALPHWAAVILHYESATHAAWRDKFEQMAASSNGSDRSRRFSPYYHQSLAACARVVQAKARVLADADGSDLAADDYRPALTDAEHPALAADADHSSGMAADSGGAQVATAVQGGGQEVAKGKAILGKGGGEATWQAAAAAAAKEVLPGVQSPATEELSEAKARARECWMMWRVEPRGLPEIHSPPRGLPAAAQHDPALEVDAVYQAMDGAGGLAARRIRCLQQRGLTLIQPPPAAAIVANVRASRRRRRNPSACDLQPQPSTQL